MDALRKKLLKPLLFLFCPFLFSQSSNVFVAKDETGTKLMVNGEAFMINGMNWDYIPRGTNAVNADFWKKSDDVIKAGLDTEMSLLKNMGVNVIRQYAGVPAKWIKYIYGNYGIYTMLNDSFGRYGLSLDGVWTPVTDYGDPRTQEYLLQEIDKLVKKYGNTPGLLLYLLGNENNYGLFWAGAETEGFPDGQEKINAIGELRGRPMYRLMNEASKRIKAMDTSHPVAICNGDILFIDIIAEECKDVDIYGTNTYRGVSFGDMFQVVKNKLDKPIMFTEFGADAYNTVKDSEDQKMQAYYIVNNWKEIYQNAAGLGKAENSLGGFTFQFSDGWWKAGFDSRKDADTQQTEATWNGGGYTLDLPYEGAYNMSEEWFGICAKGATNARGLYDLYPRAAYYALKEAHMLDPYGHDVTLDSVNNHFSTINLNSAVLKARRDKTALGEDGGTLLRIGTLHDRFSTLNTGVGVITAYQGQGQNQDSDDIDVFSGHLELGRVRSYFMRVKGRSNCNIKQKAF